MKSYKYKGEYLDTEGRDELLECLVEHGKDGWRTVSILPLEASNPASFLTLYWYVIFEKEGDLYS